MKRNMALETVILPIVEGLGYVLVGLQHFPQGRRSLLRLYVDKPGGITIDEIEAVSRQVNAALEVESPIRGEYLLEVSSPGLDRLLFTPEQFNEFLGKQVVVSLTVPMEGKRNLKGWIHSVVGEKISIRMIKDIKIKDIKKVKDIKMGKDIRKIEVEDIRKIEVEDIGTIEDQVITFPFGDIAEARLVPEW